MTYEEKLLHSTQLQYISVAAKILLKQNQWGWWLCQMGPQHQINWKLHSKV